MARLTTSKGRKLIALTAVLGVSIVLITLVLCLRFSPAVGQLQNMALAEEHIPVLCPMLQQDPRFATIRLVSYTGAGGSLLVSGELNSEKEITDLKQLVGTSHPPVEVVFHVSIAMPEKKN